MTSGMSSTRLLRLARLLSAHEGIRLTTLGRWVANHGHFFTRLEAGRTLTEARAIRVSQALSDRWPGGLPWPSDISRPAPTAPGEKAA